jgi:hypothetical protein
MFGLQGMMARLVDIAVIVAGSLLASQFRYQTVSESHFDSALVTFRSPLHSCCFRRSAYMNRGVGARCSG